MKKLRCLIFALCMICSFEEWDPSSLAATIAKVNANRGVGVLSHDAGSFDALLVLFALVTSHCRSSRFVVFWI
jgi:hypothetical protein